MKRNTILIVIATLAYSILFYDQLAGLNFFLFSIVISMLALFRRLQLAKSIEWIFYAAAAVFTGFCVFWQGSALAIAGNITALVLLAAASVSPKSSVLLNFFFSSYSILGSLIFMLLRVIDPSFRDEPKIPAAVGASNKREGMTTKKFMTFFLPFLIILIFFFIFRSANPLFKKFTDEIDLDFISFTWIVFTIGGFILTAGFFYQYRIQSLDKWELNKPKRLAFYPEQKTLSFINERSAATFLFAMLNVMLLFINAVDVHYLYMGAGLPAGITHTDFVHNGVGMLILSIIISISLMLFFFRGNLNFDEKAGPVKLLVYLWIAQNAMMIISTILRNNAYVHEYLLTYKKLGVYIYLFMALIGLATTFWKIFDKRNNWYLFRSNAFAGFALLCISSAIDIDLLITRFNIKHAKSVSHLDKTYLLSLSETNLPELYAIKDKADFSVNLSHHYSRFFNLFESRSESGFYDTDNTWSLDGKLLDFMQSYLNFDFRSFNLRRERIYKEMLKLNEEGKFTSLNLAGKEISDLSSLSPFKNLRSLNLNSTRYKKWKELSYFPALEKLELQNCALRTFDSFPPLPSLKTLNVSGNEITSFKGLSSFSNLEVLHADNTAGTYAGTMPHIKKLKELHLHNITLTDPAIFKKFPSLERLDLYGSTIRTTLPSVSGLRSLNLSNCRGTENDTAIFIMQSNPSLEELAMADNNLKSISFLYKKENNEWSVITPNLKSLNLAGNTLNYTEKLYLFRQLSNLDISRCKLYFCPDLKGMESLRKINLSDNYISNFDGLAGMEEIEVLNLSNNKLIVTFAPLASLKGLKSLNVSGTQFREPELLNQLNSLQTIDITNTPVTVTEISEIKQLTEIRLSTINEADVVSLSKMPKLDKLYVYSIDHSTREQIHKIMPGVQLLIINETTSRN